MDESAALSTLKQELMALDQQNRYAFDSPSLLPSTPTSSTVDSPSPLLLPSAPASSTVDSK